ncbi:MAG: MerC domain-containing protein [Bdellovibrionaceae bacterium]|nr:MerC domain-containing protein [Pseudobdellovibrionaceae bacterium]
MAGSHDNQNKEDLKRWDRVGAILSALCALHCVVTPFVTLSLPFWVYSVHYSPVHLALALFILPIGLYAFWNGFQRHQNKLILGLGIFGLTLLAAALTGPSSRNQLRWNDILTLIGSFSLVIAHILNRRELTRTKSH